MTEKLETYKCLICDNVIEIMHSGAGIVVCCNQNMELLKENIPQQENAHYAHIENINEITKKITFNHPMTDEHHIEYIEVISNDKKYIKRKFLQNTDLAELTFKCECKEGFYVRLYCNKDGVWTTK